jgi:hypothetical protein
LKRQKLKNHLCDYHCKCEEVFNWFEKRSNDFEFINLLNKENFKIKEGMFVNVKMNWVEALAKWIGNRKCLEVMSGYGYLARALDYMGVDIIATDNYHLLDDYKESKQFRIDLGVDNNVSPVYPIKEMDAVRAIKLRHQNNQSERKIIIMCWAYDVDESALEVVKALNKDDLLIYIGDNGILTASRNFYKSVEWFDEVSNPIMYSDFGNVVTNYKGKIAHEKPRLGRKI